MRTLAAKVVRRARRTAPARAVADALRPRRSAAAIRASGLFDEEWYREQLPEPLPAGADPVDHYVRVGWKRGLSPNPCFSPGWYLEKQPVLRRDGVEPFSHYVRRGARRRLWPHPLFDAEGYTAQVPESLEHRGGPLGHYLESGWRQGREPHPLFDSEVHRRAHPDVEGPPFADFARRTARAYRRSRGHADYPRTVPAFDTEEARRFARRVIAEFAGSGQPAPLVTVIVPTKDRARSVVETVRSVLGQTYQHWQLVVVDDGSTDGTADALAPFLADERVEYVRRDVAGGVARARNDGLRLARGDYVAYLDSDNTWVPDFLEVMVAFVVPRRIRFAYAVSELREQPGGQGRLAYRGAVAPFDAAALRERNYIDCIVVLHERSLAEEVGGFDENLRRMVDWDLFIRMSHVTEFVPVPFVATVYDAWEVRDDRITISEPWGFRFVIKSKYMLDWAAAERSLPDRVPGLTSVVVHARPGVDGLAVDLGRLDAVTPPGVEVVLVDTGHSEQDAAVLALLEDRYPRARVVRVSEPVSLEVAHNIGAVAARGEHLVFLLDGTWVDEGWLPPLLAPLAARTAAVTQPRVLTQAGVVASAGLAFSRGGLSHHLFRGFPGDGPEVMAPAARSALPPLALAVRAEDFVGVRGFDPILVNDVDSGDFSLRIAASTGRPLCYVPASMVALPPNTAQRKGKAATDQGRDNRTLVLQRWRAKVPCDDERVWGDAGYRIVGYADDQASGSGAAGAFEPIVVRERPGRPLRWAIKTGIPTVGRRQGWGDWHFALALKASLERLGQEVVIDFKNAWHRPTSHLDDVALVLRGVTDYAVQPQHTNVMWLISHPERVTAREAATFDAVFAASTTFAERFSAQHGVPVHPLLQCTDPERFRPQPPDRDRAHELLFVGNARGVRPSVAAALAAGLEPAVYGVRWKGLVPAHLWKGSHIPNEQLPAVYCAAGAVLNDHWEDMQRDGFLSNRLFDLAACGARVVSDEVPGLHDVFGDVVLTYSTPDELAAAVRVHLQEGEDRAAARQALSDRVRREHSFDARAASLVEAVTRLRAQSAGSPGASAG